MHRNPIGNTFVMIRLMSYLDLPQLMLVTIQIDQHIGQQQCSRNCTLWTNWFDQAGTTHLDFEPDLLNALGSIIANLIATILKALSEAYFWEQSDIPSTCDIYWTDAAREGKGLDINDPMLNNTALSAEDSISGYLQIATWRNPVIVKDITVQECSQQLDMQQQYQQLLSPWGSHLLL